MSDEPDIERMRRSADRVNELLMTGRVPTALHLAMQVLAHQAHQHLADCLPCRTATQRADPGVPKREALCPELVAIWEQLGQVGALVVNPDTGELGPYAIRRES